MDFRTHPVPSFIRRMTAPLRAEPRLTAGVLSRQDLRRIVAEMVG
jgi:hypothetical protein